jgi:hypothetical protein
MHAFTTSAALALLAYTSTAYAQVDESSARAAFASQLVAAIQSANPSDFPTTLSTVVTPAPEPTATAAAFDPNNYDPNDCSNPEPYLSMECMRGINAANNANIIPCDRASDCKCAERLGEGNTPFGYTETCSGSDSVPDSCLCVALTQDQSEEITDALIAFGETTCIVVNEAAEQAAKLFKLAGKVSKAKEAKWMGKIYKIGLQLWARGSKMGSCNNVGCPGHEFVAVDPEDLEAQLGLLDVC